MMLTQNVSGGRSRRTNPEDGRRYNNEFSMSLPHISEVNLVEVELGTCGGSSCQRPGFRTTEDGYILG